MRVLHCEEAPHPGPLPASGARENPLALIQSMPDLTPLTCRVLPIAARCRRSEHAYQSGLGGIRLPERNFAYSEGRRD
jgi:hypothetical protein